MSQHNRPQRAPFSGSCEENALGSPGFWWRVRIEPGISRALQGAQQQRPDILSNPTPWSFPTQNPAWRGNAAGMGTAGLEWKTTWERVIPTWISLSTARLKILTSRCWYMRENQELAQNKKPQWSFHRDWTSLGWFRVSWNGFVPSNSKGRDISPYPRLLQPGFGHSQGWGNFSGQAEHCEFQMKINPATCFWRGMRRPRCQMLCPEPAAAAQIPCWSPSAWGLLPWKVENAFIQCMEILCICLGITALHSGRGCAQGFLLSTQQENASKTSKGLGKFWMNWRCCWFLCFCFREATT